MLIGFSSSGEKNVTRIYSCVQNSPNKFLLKKKKRKTM